MYHIQVRESSLSTAVALGSRGLVETAARGDGTYLARASHRGGKQGRDGIQVQTVNVQSARVNTPPFELGPRTGGSIWMLIGVEDVVRR